MISIIRFIIWLATSILAPFKRRWCKGAPIACLVVGYGGANNTGAEARTVEAIRQMLDADPRVVVTLTSLDRRQTLRYLEETDRLKVAQINPVFIVSILRLVFRSDIVVLVEGSCFKENFSSALLWFFLYASELAQRFGIPTVAYGVDAGALSKGNRAWASKVAEKIDLLMVRTLAAERVLRSIGVNRHIDVTTDTAFTLKPESRAWAEMVLGAQGVDLGRPIVGIAFEEFFWWPVVPSIWRAMIGRKEDRYKSIYYHSWGESGKKKSLSMKEQVARYADWVVEEFGAQVVFVAMERLDIAPCRDVRAMMKSSSAMIDADHANAKQISAILHCLDWLITCRYHALVLAMGGSIPTIGLAHDERIAAIMDELGLIEDGYIFYEEGRICDLLKEKTLTLKSDIGRFRRAIERSIPGYLSRAALNEKYFADLIARKFPTA